MFTTLAVEAPEVAEPQPHPFEVDADEDGRILVAFTRLGAYVCCKVCGRDKNNEIHEEAIREE